MSEQEIRAAFEAWISAPPFELPVDRFNDASVWTGNYKVYNVHLAYCAWEDSARLIEAKTLERAVKAFEAEVETWHELKRVGYAGAIKRKGSAAIRALGEKK